MEASEKPTAKAERKRRKAAAAEEVVDKTKTKAKAQAKAVTTETPMEQNNDDDKIVISKDELRDRIKARNVEHSWHELPETMQSA